ncbi:acyl-CoA dehydrogenase family protein [Amycolatopsis sp. Poz14]|uniref:acyl-CoA dehydrogenase family protein n=1 Tax=Amycolatopsis sp. Poz14 TaxID=1447705 RepID=UPI001EE8A554|nr:acyl-CoA dehydrogenase family protein [Amycolatopsis sp. Poz14]MCG3754015.1 hypothetical protein [Amycolatopsis sp. Poz14]
MAWTQLLDYGLAGEHREVLTGWDEFVSALVPPRPEPADVPDAAAMTSTLAAIREQDWFDLALDPELPPELYFAAIARLHRREIAPPVPLLEVWSALRILGRLDRAEAAELREQTLAGQAVPVLAVQSLFSPGASGWVPFGADTTVLVAVEADSGVELLAVAPGSVEYETVNAPDPTLPSVAVPARGASLGRLDQAALDAVRAEVLTAQAAAMSGQAEAMVDATVRYLSTRVQFGVPIGSFQALRHRAADVATEVYAAHRVGLHAAERLAGHPEPLSLGLLAKAFVGAAALRASSEAVQLHGGMGFTWEGGVHFGLKRIMHLAMTGPAVGECEEELGRRAAARPDDLTWAGGLDEARGTTDTEEGTR